MKKWLENAVFYQIYPQSFKDTNADGIGDFKGIIEKLDYLQEMGFTAIWMNPCFLSTFTDAGYDIEDFYTTAPRYGSNEDLKNLFDAVHQHGMHIILDLVPGHTSYRCKWFLESMKPERNAYSDRYIWTDNIWTTCDGIPGINGSLRGISQRDGSCAVNFFSTQPALNFGFENITAPWQTPTDAPAVRENCREVIKIMKFWLNLGCDGFRVDSAHVMVKNDTERVGTIRLWQTILGEVASEYPNAVFVSEWGEPDKSLASGFDCDFLLHFGPTHYMDLFRENPYFSADGTGSVQAFFESYQELLRQVHQKGYICIPSGNHDMTRIAHYLDETQLKLAYAFLMSMPGIPFIYYGDEIGMRFREGIQSVEGGFSRTGSRSPMQWDHSQNCGFSTASPEKLYISVDPDENCPTVADQWLAEDSVLNELKKLIRLRRNTPVLQEDAAIELVNTVGYPLIYKRKKSRTSVLVVINPSREEKTFAYTAQIQSVLYQWNGCAKLQDGSLTVPPCSASYLVLAE